MTDEISNVLKTISEKGFFATSKCDSPGEVKAIDKLKAYGLIEEYVNSHLRLTKEGYRCLELGSFDNWLNDFDLKENAFSVDYLSIINGDNNKMTDVYSKLLILLNDNSESGAFIELTEKFPNISIERLKEICFELGNKIEMKPSGEYSMVFGDGSTFNNVTDKLYARIKHEGLLFLRQAQQARTNNLSIIKGDNNIVNQSLGDLNNDQAIKLIPEIKQNELKKSIANRAWKVISENKLISGIILLFISLLLKYLFKAA